MTPSDAIMRAPKSRAREIPIDERFLFRFDRQERGVEPHELRYSINVPAQVRKYGGSGGH